MTAEETAGTGRLADNITYFARALRAAGLPVGPGAVLEAVAAVEAAGIGTREDFYWTLHAVFVKRREHRSLFDQAFRIFWRRRAFIEKLMAQMSPVAPGDMKSDPAPKPAAARVAEAFAPPQRQAPSSKLEQELTARLTVSDREILKRKDFAQMSAAEIAKARRLIQELVMPDDTVATRRFRLDRRGSRIDVRQTLRRSLRAGGATIDLAFRAPATRHPPIVALVDVSGSMAEYSRLFLHFLHAAAETRRVHSFVFATRLTNITRDLAARDPDEALARASARVQDWEGGTRIAEALHTFNRLWSRRVLGQGAIVLLFTDGLERHVGPALTFEMDRLKRSCRRLIWLNPLLRYDAFEARASGIRAMLPHVHDFRPIHNLAAMEDLSNALAGEGRAHDPRRFLRRAA
jgi:uncharacterized protein